MSYHSWTIDGFGVSEDDVYAGITVDSVANLLKLSPKVEEYFRGYAGDEFTMDDVDNYEGDYEYGVMAILADVMKDCEGLYFVCCSDYDGIRDVLYEPSYPWYMKENDLHLTEDNMKTIFRKYTYILSGRMVEPNYYAVENGG